MAHESEYPYLSLLYSASDGHRHLRLLYRRVVFGVGFEDDGFAFILIHYHELTVPIGYLAFQFDAFSIWGQKEKGHPLRKPFNLVLQGRIRSRRR